MTRRSVSTSRIASFLFRRNRSSRSRVMAERRNSIGNTHGGRARRIAYPHSVQALQKGTIFKRDFEGDGNEIEVIRARRRVGQG